MESDEENVHVIGDIDSDIDDAQPDSPPIEKIKGATSNAVDKFNASTPLLPKPGQGLSFSPTKLSKI